MRFMNGEKLVIFLLLIALAVMPVQAEDIPAVSPAIAVDAGENMTVIVGEEFVLAATFSDALATGNRTASVDWGDGTGAGEMLIAPADECNGTVSAAYRYAAVGSYPVIVRVENDQGSCGEDNLTVTAEPLAPAIKIVPNTLNLKSNGVFTVFLSLAECYSGGTLADLSTVLCGEATLERVNFCMKDGGTYILKFNRQDLKNVTAGDDTSLNVTGNISTAVGDLPFAGTDTLRVKNPGKPAEDEKVNNGNGKSDTVTEAKVKESFNPFKNLEKKNKK